MPETPKEKHDPEKQKDSLDDTSLSDDQKKHDYYYDDAHGYEVYLSDEDEDEDAEAHPDAEARP